MPSPLSHSLAPSSLFDRRRRRLSRLLRTVAHSPHALSPDHDHDHDVLAPVPLHPAVIVAPAHVPMRLDNTPSASPSSLDSPDPFASPASSYFAPLSVRTPTSASRPSPLTARRPLRSVFSIPSLRSAKSLPSLRASKRAKTAGAQPVSTFGRTPSTSGANPYSATTNAGPGGRVGGGGGAMYAYQQQQTAGPSSATASRGPEPLGSSSSSASANFRPARSAPPPPGSSGTTGSPQYGANGHIYEPQHSKRDSYGGGAARSSYAPSSGRPPFSSNASSSSFQPSRPAPPLPSSSSSPSRHLHQQTSSSSLGGRDKWETLNDDNGPPPVAPPKRPPPPPMTHSLRDLSDALPAPPGAAASRLTTARVPIPRLRASPAAAGQTRPSTPVREDLAPRPRRRARGTPRAPRSRRATRS